MRRPGRFVFQSSSRQQTSRERQPPWLLRQLLVRLRAAPRADDAHAERGAEPADLAADAADADDAGSFALDQQRLIGTMIEPAEISRIVDRVKSAVWPHHS